MKRRNRSRARTVLSSPITLVLAVVILVFTARAAARIYAKAADSTVRLEDAQANLARLESKEAVLKAKIDNLSTPEGIEASIREKYHAVEPGESVAVIIDNTGATQAQAAVLIGASSTPQRGFWQRFLRAIGL